MAPAWSSPSSFSFASTLPQGGVARQASPPSPEPHPKVPRAPAAESATRAEAGGVGPGNQPVDWADGAPRGPVLRGHRLASGPGPGKAALQAPSAPQLGLGPPRPRRLGRRAQVAGPFKASMAPHKKKTRPRPGRAGGKSRARAWHEPPTTPSRWRQVDLRPGRWR